MGAEFYKNEYKNHGARGQVGFVYQAFGTPRPLGRWPDIEHPTASVSGVHVPAQYAPTFSNEEKDSSTGGLSRDYLVHKHDTLALKGIEGSLSSEEEDALHAIRMSMGLHTPPGKSEDWAREQLRRNPHVAPSTLFEETRSARTKISGMFADPSLKSSAITMAGMAYKDYGNAPIEVDDNLSSFSSRLAKNAVSKGLPITASADNPNMAITNNLDLVPRAVDPEYYDSVTSDPDTKKLNNIDISGGRMAVRNMLRGTRTRNSTPVTAKGLGDQFLPGMEGFV
jgi:hypothetical protein